MSLVTWMFSSRVTTVLGKPMGTVLKGHQREQGTSEQDTYVTTAVLAVRSNSHHWCWI